jgi:alpha-D-ribose 1-methylphosphonate 5-triphosphate synthase subunit PhnH
MTTVTMTAGATPAGAGTGAARAAGLPTALTPGGAQAVFRAALDVLARPGTVKWLPSAADEPLAEHVPAALLPLLALADLSTTTCVVDAATGAAWDEIVRVATNAPRAALGDARLVAALRPLSLDELSALRTGTAAAPEDGALACLAVAGIEIVSDTTGATGITEAVRPDVVGGAAGSDGAVGDGPGDGPGDGDDPGPGPGDGDGDGDGTRLRLRLSGPGVPGTREIVVTGLPAGFAAVRRDLVAGFPAGPDLLLIAPDGAMTGLSRTTSVNEESI